MKTETRVIRLDGGMGYQGMTGTVVEVSGERVRVKWDDQTYQYDVWGDGRDLRPVTRKGKRTWVKAASVKPI